MSSYMDDLSSVPNISMHSLHKVREVSSYREIVSIHMVFCLFICGLFNDATWSSEYTIVPNI
jgi:hypothetical protein